MGQKRRSRECSSLAKTSAPAPSAFIFPRPRSHFPHEAFGGAHEDFGPPQQQLSTMGYPRKSYPHRCSPPCAKRSRPRACARVYIIYRSPVGRSRECPRRCGKEVAPLWSRVPRRRAQGGGGRGQRRTPPRAVPRTFPAYGPVLACLRPRTCPPTATPPPADGRSAERRVGRAKAKADAPSRSNPHFPRIRPSPCLPTVESLCVKAECTRQSPPLPVRSPRVSPPTAVHFAR